MLCGNVVCRQKSEQITDKKDWRMGEAIGKFFDSFAYLNVLKVTQGSFEVFDLGLSFAHEVVDLLGSETDSPEDAVVSFGLKSRIECF